MSKHEEQNVEHLEKRAEFEIIKADKNKQRKRKQLQSNLIRLKSRNVMYA
jgi:hypothetical protein